MKKLLKFEYVNWKGARKVRTVEPIQIIFGRTPHIDYDTWLLEAIDTEKSGKRLFVLEHILRFVDERVQRFLCATVYVLNGRRELLMIHHKKFDRWCPPGGKVDNNETPDEAAVRECFEETGIRAKLIGETAPFNNSLITPIGSKCNTIVPGERDHVDLIYAAQAENEDFCKSEREANDIGWFSLNQVKEMKTFDDVPYWYTKILEKFYQEVPGARRS